MKVKVKLIGPLISRMGFSEKDLEIPEESNLKSLLQKLEIPDDLPLILTVEGKGVSREHPLREGDRVVISHIYSGG